MDEKEPEKEIEKKEDGGNAKQKKFGIWKIFLTGLVFLFALLSFTLYFSLQFLLRNWNELTVDEILYHIKSPMGGAGPHLVQLFLLSVLLPSVALFLLLLLIYLFSKRRFLPLYFSIGFFVFVLTICNAWDSISLGSYILSQIQSSSFIEDHYVDPKGLSLHFPKKKRNLIYIYMESTELTFMDKAHGGAFPENLLPELCSLGKEGEDFSAEGEIRNGGIAMPGATWTMGAMFAQSTGLPLKISIEQNSMDSQEHFFPSVTALGDILEEEGYTQKFLLGSVGYFGGRELFMKDHGNVAVEDFSYWKRKNKFPRDYWVNWGFEDEKLFTYAREELLNLAKNDRPFNLTLLTVDTHFPDGYVCRLCKNTYPDNQYANVFNCTSRQVNDFVSWIKEQDFYENTSIVISGDHPTMDRDFCNAVDSSYQRKVYTCYLNAAASVKEEKHREYSTFDDFPTTLAALGVEIPGDRLGLGTNLFSGLPTLTEEFGKKAEKKELEKRSDFMIRLGGIDKNSAFKQKEEKEQKKKEQKKEERKKS